MRFDGFSFPVVRASGAPFFLLINPWVTDFAAFDLWSSPYGLLTLAALLRDGGCMVSFVNCMDRHDPLTEGRPDVLPSKDRKFGTGKYPRMILPKPAPYAEIPRRYYRHGIHPDSLRDQLRALPRPDMIWVTSSMTYWYPGIQETIRAAREIFPDVPVWLGGIYARLCPKHALEASGASEVVNLPVALLPDKLGAATGFELTNRSSWQAFDRFPSPALDLLRRPSFAPIATSLGCPFRCPYCASQLLQPAWEKRSSDAIHDEILQWHERLGVADFAFYDDALLLCADTTLKPALKRIQREGLQLRLHTPNALHVRALTPEWCDLLRESGFTTLRLGLETTRTDRQREWGGKVETEMFQKAVRQLHASGFAKSEIGVYLLCGLPGQKVEEVAEAIKVVRESGAQPYLAEYSPVPGTPMWSEARAISPYDLESEPLYHNNSFLACRRPDFTYQDLLLLKDLARCARLALDGTTDPDRL